MVKFLFIESTSLAGCYVNAQHVEFLSAHTSTNMDFPPAIQRLNHYSRATETPYPANMLEWFGNLSILMSELGNDPDGHPKEVYLIPGGLDFFYVLQNELRISSVDKLFQDAFGHFEIVGAILPDYGFDSDANKILTARAQLAPNLRPYPLYSIDLRSLQCTHRKSPEIRQVPYEIHKAAHILLHRYDPQLFPAEPPFKGSTPLIPPSPAWDIEPQPEATD